MIFTCLSHFAAAYFKVLGNAEAGAWLVGVAKVASPTFMTLSGLLVGWRFQVAPEQFTRFRSHLMDRALFLLTIGHLLIQASQLRRLTFAGEVPDFLVMTDVIAIACIVGPMLVVRLRARTRLIIGIVMLAVVWTLLLQWTPQADLARELKAILIGLRGTERGIGGNCVAVLPWLSVYIAASWLGQVLADRSSVNGGVLNRAVLWRVGLPICLGAASVRGLAIVLTRGFGASGIESEAVSMLTSPWQKMPPGPDYLVFFGGAGLCMAAAIAHMRALAMGRVVSGWLETLGRNSLVVFILQFYIYALLIPVVLPLVHPTRIAYWPLVFAGTIGALVLFAREWEHRRLNRLLTVQPFLRLLPAPRMQTALAVGLAALLLVLSAHLHVPVMHGSGYVPRFHNYAVPHTASLHS